MARKFLSDAQRSWNVEVNRNTFDSSKTHNASYNFGYIYPMRVIPVQPNESYRIKTSGGFDLKPMIGVSQTHVKCNTAWFYCRDFQVWQNANKFAMQDPTVSESKYPHPLIDCADKKYFSVGSLLHHMGVPVSTVGVYQNNAVVPVVDSSAYEFTRGASTLSVAFNLSLPGFSFVSMGVSGFQVSFYKRSFSNWLSSADGNIYCHRTGVLSATSYTGIPILLGQYLNYYSLSSSHLNTVIYPLPMTKRVSDYSVSSPWSFVFPHINKTSDGVAQSMTLPNSFCMALFAGSGNESFADTVLVGSIVFSNSAGNIALANTQNSTVNIFGINTAVRTQNLKLTPTRDQVEQIQRLQDKYGSLYVALVFPVGSSIAVDNVYAGSATKNDAVEGDELKPASVDIIPGFYGGFSYMSDVLVNTDVDSPFCGLGTDAKEHLNALPVRHYEAIINSHFRNRVLDPFRIDGEIAIDRYNTNQGDGLDSTTPLELAKCNYESDYFTTCMPTPQGNMFNQPLVGITMAADPVEGSADLHYSEDGQEYTIGVETGPDGKMIGMNYNSEDANRLTVLTLKDAISYGISLQDIENRRALAKWYEATYRRGRFSSDDFVEAHFGKRPISDAMHAPEYLGGDSLPLSVMRVLNNSTSDGGVLGASGGLGSFATKKDKPGVIECYCDRPGFIIGVCWFSVTPTYGQAIDKFWYRKLPSDYPTPEFADLGTMPVLNKELAPLQCNWDDSTADDYANGTFGYQRIYGDKLQAFDTIAGDYADDLNSLLLYRQFPRVPKLGVDFVTQTPEDLNNIFVLDNDRDKIYGQWHFDVQCKLWFNQTPNAQIF